MAADGTRRSVLPIEHLEAELLAAPLASPVAFRRCLVELDCKLGDGTSALWREQERDLLSRFPGMSIDELIIRRDRAWFGSPPLKRDSRLPLLNILRSSAKDLLIPHTESGARGETLRGDLDWRRKWRWTTFALPPDLLFASIGRLPESDGLVSAPLRLRLLDRGFSEPHLHLKAALQFPVLWASLQRAIADPDAREDMLASPAADFNEGRDLARWLIRCALSRLTLAAFLANPGRRKLGFRDYLQKHVLPRVTALEGPVMTTMFSRAMREIGAGSLADHSPRFEILRLLYASLTARQSRSSSAAPSGPDWLDPLAHWFPPHRGGHPEFHFLSAAFTYLDDKASQQDQVFARLFWQTQRLRTFFYRHIVQRPMTPGLQWFTRTYDRLSAPRRPLDTKTFMDSAVRLAGPGLKALEVRIAPSDNVSELARVVREIDAAADPKVEVGIVYHFIRTRGPDAQSGSPRPWGYDSHDDPASGKLNPTGYRFSGYYLQKRAEAAALGNLLLTYPRMLERVRGVDLCTDELGIPLWVLLPLIRHVRRASQIAQKVLQGSAHPVSPLRMTVHAGEDYVHLMGSIRRVGEAVEYLGLREGDRIGHGVSLGVAVEDWAMRASGLAIPQGERLFDLIWASRCAMQSDMPDLRSWLPWVGHETCRLALAIFGKDYSLAELEQWVLSLHTSEGLAQAGFPCGPKPQSINSKTTMLMAAWLHDKRVFERAQQLTEVNITQEVSLVSSLQAYVRGLLARLGIAVEINPSSNLLIGHLGDLSGHPLWRLCPPIDRGMDSNAIRVCIGSDDPITFSTRLPEEYQLLVDGMVEGGLSSYDVDQWLDRALTTGLVTRFTVPRSNRLLTFPTNFTRIPIAL